MVVVTNNNRNHAVTVGGQKILPGNSKQYETVDLSKLKYLISTGDISVSYASPKNATKTKPITRRASLKDTINIDGSDDANVSEAAESE